MTDPYNRESYAILDPDETRFGPCIAMVTDAVSGRQTAYFAGGFRVVIGEQICSGCDDPIEDGPCGCVVHALGASASPTALSSGCAGSRPYGSRRFAHQSHGAVAPNAGV